MSRICLINKDILKPKIPKKFLPINLCVTSPPYNLDKEYENHKDNIKYDTYLKWSEQWMKRVFKWMADDGRVCINVPFKITPPYDKKNNYSVSADFIALMKKVGFKFFNQLTWDKGNKAGDTCWGSFDSASSPFIRDPAESIIIFYKGNQWKRLEPDPGKKKSSKFRKNEFVTLTQNVWKFGAERKKNVGGHPSAFPIDLPTRCIRLFSYKTDIVLDIFMGAGTTGHAAVNEGRKYVGIEISPQYFEFAKNRIIKAKL